MLGITPINYGLRPFRPQDAVRNDARTQPLISVVYGAAIPPAWAETAVDLIVEVYATFGYKLTDDQIKEVIILIKDGKIKEKDFLKLQKVYGEGLFWRGVAKKKDNPTAESLELVRKKASAEILDLLEDKGVSPASLNTLKTDPFSGLIVVAEMVAEACKLYKAEVTTGPTGLLSDSRFPLLTELQTLCRDNGGRHTEITDADARNIFKASFSKAEIPNYSKEKTRDMWGELRGKGFPLRDVRAYLDMPELEAKSLDWENYVSLKICEEIEREMKIDLRYPAGTLGRIGYAFKAIGRSMVPPLLAGFDASVGLRHVMVQGKEAESKPTGTAPYNYSYTDKKVSFYWQPARIPQVRWNYLWYGLSFLPMEYTYNQYESEGKVVTRKHQFKIGAAEIPYIFGRDFPMGIYLGYGFEAIETTLPTWQEPNVSGHHEVDFGLAYDFKRAGRWRLGIKYKNWDENNYMGTNEEVRKASWRKKWGLWPMIGASWGTKGSGFWLDAQIGQGITKDILAEKYINQPQGTEETEGYEWRSSTIFGLQANYDPSDDFGIWLRADGEVPAVYKRANALPPEREIKGSADWYKFDARLGFRIYDFGIFGGAEFSSPYYVVNDNKRDIFIGASVQLRDIESKTFSWLNGMNFSIEQRWSKFSYGDKKQSTMSFNVEVPLSGIFGGTRRRPALGLDRIVDRELIDEQGAKAQKALAQLMPEYRGRAAAAKELGRRYSTLITGNLSDKYFLCLNAEALGYIRQSELPMATLHPLDPSGNAVFSAPDWDKNISDGFKTAADLWGYSAIDVSPLTSGIDPDDSAWQEAAIAVNNVEVKKHNERVARIEEAEETFKATYYDGSASDKSKTLLPKAWMPCAAKLFILGYKTVDRKGYFTQKAFTEAWDQFKTDNSITILGANEREKNEKTKKAILEMPMPLGVATAMLPLEVVEIVEGFSEEEKEALIKTRARYNLIQQRGKLVDLGLEIRRIDNGTIAKVERSGAIGLRAEDVTVMRFGMLDYAHIDKRGTGSTGKLYLVKGVDGDKMKKMLKDEDAVWNTYLTGARITSANYDLKLDAQIKVAGGQLQEIAKQNFAQEISTAIAAQLDIVRTRKKLLEKDLKTLGLGLDIDDLFAKQFQYVVQEYYLKLGKYEAVNRLKNLDFDEVLGLELRSGTYGWACQAVDKVFVKVRAIFEQSCADNGVPIPPLALVRDKGLLAMGRNIKSEELVAANLAPLIAVKEAVAKYVKELEKLPSNGRARAQYNMPQKPLAVKLLDAQNETIVEEPTQKVLIALDTMQKRKEVMKMRKELQGEEGLYLYRGVMTIDPLDTLRATISRSELDSLIVFPLEWYERTAVYFETEVKGRKEAASTTQLEQAEVIFRQLLERQRKKNRCGEMAIRDLKFEDQLEKEISARVKGLAIVALEEATM